LSLAREGARARRIRATNAQVAPRDSARYTTPGMQAAELLVLVVVVGAIYWALTPLRRWLEPRIGRLLRRRRRAGGGRVIPLARRSDGTFGRKEKEEE